MGIGINEQYFEKSDSIGFIKDLKNTANLQIRLKSLSSDDREFIDVANKVAISNKEGKWNSFLELPYSDASMLGQDKDFDFKATKSSGGFYVRVEQIKQNLLNAPDLKEPSNIFLRILKGIGNLFGRISSASLYNRITKIQQF